MGIVRKRDFSGQEQRNALCRTQCRQSAVTSWWRTYVPRVYCIWSSRRRAWSVGEVSLLIWYSGMYPHSHSCSRKVVITAHKASSQPFATVLSPLVILRIFAKDDFTTPPFFFVKLFSTGPGLGGHSPSSIQPCTSAHIMTLRLMGTDGVRACTMILL